MTGSGLELSTFPVVTGSGSELSTFPVFHHQSPNLRHQHLQLSGLTDSEKHVHILLLKNTDFISIFQVPSTEGEWTEVQNVFETTWNFPNCCGALDGKHVQIRRPFNSTSQFYNYKGTYSIVLFASVDGNYCFRYIDVGSDGRASDSTIFQTSTLMSALEQNLLGWPELGVFIGDDIFPLSSNLLKHRNLTLAERIFSITVCPEHDVSLKTLLEYWLRGSGFLQNRLTSMLIRLNL